MADNPAMVVISDDPRVRKMFYTDPDTDAYVTSYDNITKGDNFPYPKSTDDPQSNTIYLDYGIVIENSAPSTYGFSIFKELYKAITQMRNTQGDKFNLNILSNLDIKYPAFPKSIITEADNKQFPGLYDAIEYALEHNIAGYRINMLPELDDNEDPKTCYLTNPIKEDNTNTQDIPTTPQDQNREQENIGSNSSQDNENIEDNEDENDDLLADISEGIDDSDSESQENNIEDNQDENTQEDSQDKVTDNPTKLSSNSSSSIDSEDQYNFDIGSLEDSFNLDDIGEDKEDVEGAQDSSIKNSTEDIINSDESINSSIPQFTDHKLNIEDKPEQFNIQSPKLDLLHKVEESDSLQEITVPKEQHQINMISKDRQNVINQYSNDNNISDDSQYSMYDADSKYEKKQAKEAMNITLHSTRKDNEARVYVFASNKGGVGKTFNTLAVSRRYAKLHPDQKIAIVDFDIAVGQIAAQLNIYTPTMEEYFVDVYNHANVNIIDYAVQHSAYGDNAYFYLAPPETMRAKATPRKYYSNLLADLITEFDAVFIDTGFDYNIYPIVMAMKLSTRIVLISTDSNKCINNIYKMSKALKGEDNFNNNFKQSLDNRLSLVFTNINDPDFAKTDIVKHYFGDIPVLAKFGTIRQIKQVENTNDYSLLDKSKKFNEALDNIWQLPEDKENMSHTQEDK